MNKVILHVDINSYFATLAQQENPFLRHKPLGVVKDTGRTCLIAASKEAKKYGVRTGSLLKDARQLCPHLITIPAEFDRYLDATKRLQKIFQHFSPNVFIYSLDEAFLDLSGCQRLYASPKAAAQQLQQTIKKELGDWVTCNIGLAPNRFLAKMASSVAHTGTINIVTPDNLDSLLASTPFSDVCGVGFRLEAKLNQLGITNLYQLRLYPEFELEQFFGPFWTKELLKMAYGQETHLLSQLDHPPEHMKSVGRSITGFKLHDDEDEIRAVILNLIEEVTHKVRKLNLAGRYVWLKLYGSNPDERWQTHQTLTYHIRHTKDMFDLLYIKQYQGWRRNFKVIKFAVRLGLLEPLTTTSQPLLPEWHRQERIAQAVDTLTQKYGLFTVHPGLFTRRDIIRPEVTGFLGDRDYQLNLT
jgi:DNA polymerase-4